MGRPFASAFPERMSGTPRIVNDPISAARRGHWRLEDIGLDRVDAAAAGDWLAFRIAATASFIESGSDLYAHNLVAFFAGDAELVRWLGLSWEPEEMRHGAALRAYVERVWPAFDWEARFHAFLDEYSRTCTVPELEPTRALELAARCIVEMGTSALYRALHGYARDPVLRELAGRIYADEIRHYKHFYQHFRRYRRRERQSMLRVGQTLVRRLMATRSEDGRCAYRRVWDFAPSSSPGCFERDYRVFARDLTMLVRRHAPSEMLTRMILKPLALPSPVVGTATRLSDPLYRLWLNAGP
jgi:hypothetical protein